MEGPQLRTLRRALRLLGGKEQLAAALGIDVGELEAYLEDEKEIPAPVFLLALDIVAGK